MNVGNAAVWDGLITEMRMVIGCDKVKVRVRMGRGGDKKHQKEDE